MAKQREAGMMAVFGAQGVGKTYQNMRLIHNYVKDKIQNKVKGRKCLIFDTNGEYTESQFERNDVRNFKVPRIAVSDVEAWGKDGNVECRRVDASGLGYKEKKDRVEHIIHSFRGGLFVLEDINTYILSITHMVEIVSALVNLRHRAADVLISYQSLRYVEPRVISNSRWMRMHYQPDNVMDVKGKLPDMQLFKIAQIIINNRYQNGDTRFFLYIYNMAGGYLRGKFTKTEFELACRQFINANRAYMKEHAAMHQLKEPQAVDGLINQYTKLYFGNNK